MEALNVNKCLDDFFLLLQISIDIYTSETGFFFSDYAQLVLYWSNMTKK
jgi:hypothetical protein